MTRFTLLVLVCWAICFPHGPLSAAESPLVANGGFESNLAGWRPFWTRDKGAGSAVVDQREVRSGKSAVRIEHRGEKDWSLEPEKRIEVKAVDLFELSAWFKRQGQGGAVLCVSTWNAKGEAVSWDYGGREVEAAGEWREVRTRIVVPEGVAQIQPRIIGNGPATVWVDDFAVEKKGNVLSDRPANLAAGLTISNAFLIVTVETAKGTLTVRDRRNQRSWQQSAVVPEMVMRDARLEGGKIDLKLLHVTQGQDLSVTVRLEGDKPELVLELTGAGRMSSALRYPHPFATRAGEYLVVPMNEGISYPVEDQSISPFRLIAYGGHGICMAFWGVTDGDAGHIAILETPDDVAIRGLRIDGRLAIAPEWEAQKGQFGYARRLRYAFFDSGGHVAIAKRYRVYARETGLLKTLAEKRQANPNVDLLIGAVNIWCWDRNAVPLVREIQAAGIERILWSNRQTPENLRALNELGVLTSRYDIYQDVMNPENFPKLRGVHSDWTTKAWPQDIILNASGQWIKGWGVEAKDGTMIHCGVICDRRAPDYARERIPAELATHPYRSRFIDTTTAAPWHECYSPEHPMTRSESKKWKMELLRCVSEDNRLVTGCETGHDASVPFLHYFEGMLSLGPYRVPDAGRRMSVIWTDVPERVAKFQLGHRYRLPLWELVYHDCVVAQWYWGDYNNKLPALWDKRDLFNLLYGTPPMFMFDRKLWEQTQARFVQSYRNTCPHVRKVGYEEMTDHRFLTPDRDVQQTRFANGMVFTVNFGERAHRMADGYNLAAGGFRVEEARR